MSRLLKIVKWALFSLAALVVGLAAYSYYTVVSFDTESLPKNHGKAHAELFPSSGPSQPLIVALGGAEGGNGWAGPHGSKQRKLLYDNGYALLAIGYFGMDGSPENLDRIAIEGVHKKVMEAAQSPDINSSCIAVMGVSRGGELALLLGSRYEEYKSVVGIVPGSSVFASITDAMVTSGFSQNGEPLPFVPVPWSAAPNLITGDLRGAFEKMMVDTEAMEAAAIKVEAINGPVLLISGTEDEQWPSMEMSEMMMERLKKYSFPYPSLHLPLEGGHNEHHDEFDKVIEFLDKYLRSQPGCSK